MAAQRTAAPGAPVVYLEHQHDARRGTIVLVASTGFGSSGSRHAITVEVADAQAARAAWRDWQELYADTGAQVVT